jgi:hypothetical protein
MNANPFSALKFKTLVAAVVAAFFCLIVPFFLAKCAGII